MIGRQLVIDAGRTAWLRLEVTPMSDATMINSDDSSAIMLHSLKPMILLINYELGQGARGERVT